MAEQMQEEWVIFRHAGRVICGYTMRDTFPGELEETIKLLAQEKGIPAEEITCTVETRNRQPAAMNQ